MEVTEVQYKESEIGVIPVDWEVKQLSTIGKFTKGQGIRKDEATNGEIPCVRYGELYTRHNDYIKEYFSFISNETAKSARRLRPGDILFAGSGETKEEIGKCAAFVDNIEAYAGGDIVILSPIDVSPLFLGYLLNAQHIQKQKASKGQGDAIVHISANQLGSIQIPLPPTKSEQTAIATALSDTDALIENLEKLIAKKRNIKQGVMQELFKPKDYWKLTSLSDLSWFQEGPGVRNYQFTTTGVKLLNGSNIENGKLNLNNTTRHISTQEAYGMYSHFLADNGDIVIASSGISIGNFHEKVTYVNSIHLPLCMNTSTIRFKVTSSLLMREYLYYFLKSEFFKQQIGGQATGSAQLNFGPSHVKRVILSVPPMEEQSSIVSILHDADADIDNLELKLLKIQQIKKGMMQTLLTGKIRLV